MWTAPLDGEVDAIIYRFTPSDRRFGMHRHHHRSTDEFTVKRGIESIDDTK